MCPLKAKNPIRSNFLVIDDTGNSPASYRDRRVSIVAFMRITRTSHFRPLRSTRLILLAIPQSGLCAVGMKSQPKWLPCFVGDVKTDTSFRCAPGTLQAAQRTDQDRGLVIPIMRVPDLPLPDQHQSDTALRVAASGAGVIRRTISYVYSIDLTANPTAAPNDFDHAYLIKDEAEYKDFEQCIGCDPADSLGAGPGGSTPLPSRLEF